MNRKVITVPINKIAQVALDTDEASQDQLIELKLSDSSFYQLWNHKIFEMINKTAEVNIDDFESEFIEDLNKIRKTQAMLKRLQSDQQIQFLSEIINLFEEAERRKTGIYFFF